MGRKCTYDEGQADKVCGLIASGNALVTACKKAGIPPRTWYDWLRRIPELRSIYEMAVEERGNYYGERVNDIANETLEGKHDPKAARVAIDAYKWTSARMAPKNFGDRQTVKVETAHSSEDLERFAEQHGLRRLTEAIPEASGD